MLRQWGIPFICVIISLKYWALTYYILMGKLTSVRPSIHSSTRPCRGWPTFHEPVLLRLLYLNVTYCSPLFSILKICLYHSPLRVLFYYQEDIINFNSARISVICRRLLYVVGSKSFRPDIQKPRQVENAVRDI